MLIKSSGDFVDIVSHQRSTLPRILSSAVVGVLYGSDSENSIVNTEPLELPPGTATGRSATTPGSSLDPTAFGVGQHETRVQSKSTRTDQLMESG